MGIAELTTRITQPFASGRVLVFTLPKLCAYTAFKQAVGLKGLQQAPFLLVAVSI